MSGKSRWWTSLFRRKDIETTTVELSDDSLPPAAAPAPISGDGAPSAGGFTFLTPESAQATTAEPVAAFDTLPNIVATTGRLRALGLAPVLVPSLAEQVLLYRVVAQEFAQGAPAEALARWQAILTLCPDDVEARVGAARAYAALDRSVEAEAAWRGVLEIAPDHPEAAVAVNPTELRRALPATEAE